MQGTIVILYQLIIILVGTTISFCEGNPTTLDLCRQDGIRVIQDYQQGGIRAKYECEAR